MKRRVNINDIAKKAGVSSSTVSRVLNKKKTSICISEETKQRVLSTAEKLNYTPNMLARNFRSQKSNTIALLVADAIDLYISSLISAAERALNDLGYTCLLSNIPDCDKQKEFCINAFNANQIDGVIVTSFKIPREENHFQDLIKNNIPFVLIGGDFPNQNVSYIKADNVLGGKILTQHLISLGHKKIFFIDCGYSDSKARLEGYNQALVEAGIASYPSFIIQSDLGASGGYKAIKDYLKDSAAPTAIFCCDDKVAFGVLRALHEFDISIPDDCSVTGFDDIEFSQYSHPSLTTVSQPSVEMGKKGAMLIMNKLENSNGKPQQIILPTNLIVRESTGPIKN